jgi:hypothetical protein
MRSRLLSVVLGVAAAGLVFSCGPTVGTDVGNGATVAVEMRGYDKQKTTAPLSMTLVDGTSIDELWVVSSRFRVRRASSDTCAGSGADEEKLAGPFVADLVGDGFVGGPPILDTAATGYCRLWIDIGDSHATLPAGSPAELEGASIFVRGTRRDGVPFRITSKLKTDLRLDAKSGTPFVVPEGDSQLFIAFPLDEILAASGIDLLAGADIVVDAENEKETLKAFEAAFRKAAKLFRDGDDDGDLDLDEAQEGEALAVIADE